MPASYPLPGRPHHRIRHPTTDTETFGTFPRIHTKRYVFPEAPIFLLFGEHRGPHRGYGFRHIHAQRFPDIEQIVDAIQHVAQLVAGMIARGSSIHCEFASLAREVPLVIRQPNRVLVLEHRTSQHDDFYSVRTFYEEAAGRQKNKGPKIGAFE